MFYSYGLSFDRQSSVAHSLSLSVASSEAQAATTRKNGNVLPLGLASAQNICGAPSPFSSEFTFEFGGGNYVLVTVNKGLGAVDAQAAFLSEPPTRFHLNTQTAPATSSYSAAMVEQHFASVLAAVADAGVANLVYAKPWHAVVAAKSGQHAAGIRGIFKKVTGATSAQAQATAVTRTIGRAYAAVDAEVSGLIRSSSLLRSAVSGEVTSTIRTMGKAVGTVGSQVAFLLKMPGKLLGAVDAETVAIARGSWPYRLSVASSETAHLSFGSNVYQRVFGALFGEVIGLQRGLVVFRGTTDASTAGAVKTPSKILSAVDAESTAFFKQAGVQRGVVDAQSLSFARQVGLVRGVIDAAVQGLQRAAAHFAAAMGTVDAQSTSSVVQRTAGHQMSISRPQSSTVSLSALRTLLRAMGVASTQAVGAVHGMAKVVSAASSAAQNMVRSLTKILGVASTYTAATISLAAHFFISGLASPESITLIQSHSTAKGTTSAESVALVRQRGWFRSVVGIQAIALRKFVGKLALAFNPQAPAVGRGDIKAVGTASPNVARLITPHGHFLRTSQGQVAATVVYYHFYVATWAYQQTSLLPPSGGPAEPPSFGPIDPADQTIFAFDWSSRAYPNDAILSAVVTSVPSGLSFLTTPFINGTLIEVTVPPFVAPTLPTSYSLRCTATFASGRVSSFSIPVPVRTL